MKLSKEDEIIYMNEKIAKFMGVYIDNGNVCHFPDYIYLPGQGRTKGCLTNELMYNTNWEWIMAVVQKIHKTHPKHEMVPTILTLSITTPIHKVFTHCFNYVQWYFD